MRPALRTALFAVAALAFLPLLAFAQGDENIVTIGTGSVTGVYYPAGGAICRLMNEQRKQTNLRCLVESTTGSIYNLQALRAHDIDFAIIQSDWQYDAYKGKDVFADAGPYKDLRSVFSLHSEVFTVAASKKSGIHNFRDLKGKRVNIGDPGSGMRATMDALMEYTGWSRKSFAATTELKPTDAASALCHGQIDAMVFTAGHPNGLIQELTAQCGAVLVPVEGPAVTRLLTDNPFYARAVIPGGMYHGNAQETPSFGVRATLVTNADMDDETVYQLTKAVFDNMDTFKTLHFVFATLDPTHMVTAGQTAPLHPGAARYFREAGLLKPPVASDNQ
ncbi:MAG: TAXI family TRAP transporter solute-binding subunit [Alphaproteobacteria bacterium]